jgi:1-phosphofructokinase
MMPNHDPQRVCVLAPSPLLTVTLEAAGGDNSAEIHLHAGGQGFWVARLMHELGAEVTLCASFGGETGHVIRSLLDEGGLTVRWVDTAAANGAYVDDRRTGERQRLGVMAAGRLSRHEADALYSMALVEGLDSGLCVLGGPGPDAVLPSDVYRRLSSDLVANGRVVVADLSGEPLEAAVAGHASVVKVSDEELRRDRRIRDTAVPALVGAMRDLGSNGQQAVVCSRADRPALAYFGDRVVEVRGPVMEALDSAGAGDSFTAGMAAALARGLDFETALRVGAAAGALNVTRRGLGTGDRHDIERLAEYVEVHDVEV